MRSSDILFFIKLIGAFLPFVLLAFVNSKVNCKQPVRSRQYPMPALAAIYSIVLLIFMDKLAALFMKGVLFLADLLDKYKVPKVGAFIRDIYNSWGVLLMLVLFNTLVMLVYVLVKRIVTAILAKTPVSKDGVPGKIVGIFYSYSENDSTWYIKNHFGQACTFLKTVYITVCILSAALVLITSNLCMKGLISEPFYPVFALIVIGELAFFVDGPRQEEQKPEFSMAADDSKRVAKYPLLKNPLRELFGDKLSAEGTTVNNAASIGGTVEDILVRLEAEGGHIGKNYAAFIRKKSESGLKPSVDYVRSGYDLATGKSLLFNTPFYDKLNPYMFYAMNRNLLTGGKALIVLGRHGTEEDLLQWCEKGMQQISNIPGLWKTEVLSAEKRKDEEDLPDIGIISRSGVHNLDIHKNNLPFLRDVSFVVLVEPSRLVTTAQIGLNLLIKCCGKDRSITFCSVDRNCDGLVDALSHVLMTNITEVSATEYPHGISSYMYWTADQDYLQHRILPGVSRCLGMGTELSMVALKNQIKKAVWYGGEAYPVKDVRWIAKQYYYDLLEYAKLPANQENFDKSFQTSLNMCNQKETDYAFVVVEDDRNNLFETRRNFATIAEEQGFINVISTEYMLREYMSGNPDLFTTDAKAIPYITADYARTRRNAILSVCLMLCVDCVPEDALNRQMVVLNIDTKDPTAVVWQEICLIFAGADCSETDRQGNPKLRVAGRDGKTVTFEKDKTILFKRAYNVESGRFESVYTIENEDFAKLILDDLQNATYIAEQESKDEYIGTELKGHVYQKYMPGQFFTLNGKYYEMISTTRNNRILVRRASEHIGARLVYRQVRNYIFHHIEDAQAMGSLKTVNDIGIYYQYADFSVETPGYWKLTAYNDFASGTLTEVNGVPVRQYRHKQILKFDFSKLGDAFTDSVRMTLTNLLNESFVTLFAENQPFISAITPGWYGAPLTYSLTMEADAGSDKCIYIVEDSQLDIGLLVAVERNVSRIFQIISDYLSWNDEQIQLSLQALENPAQTVAAKPFDVYAPDPKVKKECWLKRFWKWIKSKFSRKTKAEPAGETAEQPADPEATDPQAAAPEGTDPQAIAPVAAPEGEAVSDPAAGPEAEQAAAPQEALTPKQQKKAAKAAAKAERKAQKEQAKAEKLAKKQQAKEEKQARKLQKQQEKAAKKQGAAQPEAAQPENSQQEDAPAADSSEVEVTQDA